MGTIIQHPSPNFNARAGGRVPDMLLLHYTGMKTGTEALNRMCDAVSQVAAHYMVDVDGTIYQLVDEKDRAWHAGVAHWAGEDDINDCSIGLEIVNPGHEFGYCPFPDQQMAAVVMLAKDIVARHGINPARIVGHSDVAPTRKLDPGELFNWQLLAEQGVGLWPKDIRFEASRSLQSGDEGRQVSALQEQLVAIGYGLDITGCYDITTLAVITAFQRHFVQGDVTGVADKKTQNTITAVIGYS